jgi:hypothetical protein
MYSLLFVIFSFFYFAILGISFLSFFKNEKKINYYFLTPLIGLSIITLLVFLINRLSFPVKEFGLSLFLISIIFCIFSFIKKNTYNLLIEILQSDKVKIYLILNFGALIALGFPFFKYDLSWISVLNEDMTNYTLGAQRFYYKGFFEPFNPEALKQGKNYYEIFYSMHGLSQMRSGAELLLAYKWSITGINAQKIFMPSILTYYLILNSIISSFVSKDTKNKTFASIIFFALISPLTVLAYTYQMIAQFIGMSFLLGILTIVLEKNFLKNLKFKKLKSFFSLSVIISLLFGVCFFIWYPELIPFVAIAYIIFNLISQVNSKKLDFKFILVPIIILIPLFLILNNYIYDSFNILLRQLSTGTSSVSLDKLYFPSFLIPSGLSAILGLSNISHSQNLHYIEIAILLSLLFFVFFAFKILPYLYSEKTNLFSIVIIIILLWLFLFFKKSDFGNFKVSIIAQPFLYISFVYFFSKFIEKLNKIYRKILIFIIIFFIILNLNTSYTYLAKSYQKTYSTMSGIRADLSSVLINDLEDIFKGYKNQNKNIVFLTDNIVLAKLVSFYATDLNIFFPNRNVFWQLIDGFGRGKGFDKELDYIKQFHYKTKNSYFEFDKFNYDLLKNKENIFLLLKNDDNLFNTLIKSKFNTVNNNLVELTNDNKNFLNPIHTEQSNHFYLGKLNSISRFQIEDDMYFGGIKTAALGDTLIFEALNLKDNFNYVNLDFSASHVKQYETKYGNIIINKQKIQLNGSGMCRFYYGTRALKIKDKEYIIVEFENKAKNSIKQKGFFINLYNKQIHSDIRRYSNYAREVNLIDKKTYNKLITPEFIELDKSEKKFKEILKNVNLEVCGIYENGLLSDDFSVYLKKKNHKEFIIKGSSVFDNNDYKLFFNDKLVLSGKLKKGNFEIKKNIENENIENGKIKINLVFSNYKNFAYPDLRKVTVDLHKIGFFK